MSNKYEFISPIVSGDAKIDKFRGEENNDPDISYTHSSLTIREVVPAAQYNVRCERGDEGFALSLTENLKMAFPLKPCTYRYDSQSQLYWLGPDEWLLVSAIKLNFLEKMSLNSSRAHVAITDLSGGQIVLNLSGAVSSVEAVLKKSSVYDFGAWMDADQGFGRCVRTTFAKTSALIANRSDQSFDVIVRRSFADYVVRWLMDAGGEFGCTFERHDFS